MQKCMTSYTIHMRTIALFIACAALVVPQALFAVTFIPTTERTEYSWRDRFLVPIRIDTQGLCINAVEVVINYDPRTLQVDDVARGNSILSLWTEEPTIDKDAGRVTFSGGVPGGYCGRVEGDPGLTNILAEVVVTGAPLKFAEGARELAEISISPDSRALAHDGAGTPLPVAVQTTQFVLSATTTVPVDEWQGRVRNDTIAPELFEIALLENRNVAGGRYFIVFRTSDKQSGIDHYEVLETDPDRFGLLTWLPRESYWVVAESPYVLRDQDLKSKIMVKAIDKAGNERIVTYTPPLSPLDHVARVEFFLLLFVGAGIILALVAVFAARRRRITTHTVPQADVSEEDNTHD